MNILTSLKTASDLKWTLKPFNTNQYTSKYQDKRLSSFQRKKLIEQCIKLRIQKVGCIIYG